MQDQPSSPKNSALPQPLTDAIRAGLRRATPADAAAVRDLTRAAYAKWVPVLGREPKPMTADYDAAVRDHVVDMLHLDEKLAALIEMRPEADHLLIVNVAVSPAHQGRGVWPRPSGTRRRTRPFARPGGVAPLHEQPLDREREAIRAGGLQGGPGGGSLSASRYIRTHEQASPLTGCPPSKANGENWAGSPNSCCWPAGLRMSLESLLRRPLGINGALCRGWSCQP